MEDTGCWQFARESNQAGVEAEQAGQRFLAAADSAAEAGAEMAFFRAEAERLKLDIAALQQPYSGFLVALKDTSLRGQQARDIFTAVGTAARVLSLDGEALNGVFTALEQIVGKGVVSTEDLRDQLGSRLSGAFAAAARAMEVSTQELGEMLQRARWPRTNCCPGSRRNSGELSARTWIRTEHQHGRAGRIQ